MHKDLSGVWFQRIGDYAVCHIEFLSDDVKELIRKNLTSICHGSKAIDHSGSILFGYKATLKSFLERYKTKAPETQIGMIGEFLSHILIPYYFDDFQVVSPFFNLEEKSIKKGFDLLLFRPQTSSVWITEVKSGNVHKEKDYDETIVDLLKASRDDLVKRLGSEETIYWYNALNTVLASVSKKKDYKDALEEILEGYGSAAASNAPNLNNKYVVLVSNLFEPLKPKIQIETAATFHKKVSEAKTFSEVIVMCMQKATYHRVAKFLEDEPEVAEV